jgi:hypothetical protein
MTGNAARIGFLFDGDPTTDLMSALYEFDETGVRLHVPFMSNEDVRSRWWSHGILHMDDLDRTKYYYEPASELDYIDYKGPVGLLGCVSSDATRDVGGGVGRGTISARYALEGAREAANFTKLNGFRSEIDGLSYWLAYSAHQTSIKRQKDGRPSEVTTTMKPVDAVTLGTSLNLKAIAKGTAPGGWSPEAAYRSRVFIETFSTRPREWQEHLELHYAVRNLVRVAAWRPINFQSHQATSLKESVDLRGKLHNQWREVRTATTGVADSVWRTQDRFMFAFSEIGTKGISRWLKLVSKYEHGITPLVGLLDLEGATIDAIISQLGIAIEAVGYQSLVDSGKTPAAANRTNVANRIDHLIDEVRGSLSFPHATFGQGFADSYNSVKHANRDVVAPEVKIDHFQNGVELLRVWIALRLGLKPTTLESPR